MMFELSSNADEDARPLCPLPLILREDEWVDWELPKNHVLREKYELLELNFLGGLYAEQKQMLDAYLENELDAPFVASFSAVQKENTEKVSSYSVWGDGVDTILPRTQLIMLASENRETCCGEWEHVASVVGDLMEPDESYYPTRYRVRQFPTPEQLAEIGNLAL